MRCVVNSIHNESVLIYEVLRVMFKTCDVSKTVFAMRSNSTIKCSSVDLSLVIDCTGGVHKESSQYVLFSIVKQVCGCVPQVF